MTRAFNNWCTKLGSEKVSLGELRADGTLVADIRGEDLAQLLALDALTVVGGAVFQHDALSPRSLGPLIWRDAMLLEQQLPFFILQAAMESIRIESLDFINTTVELQNLVSFYAKQICPFPSHVKRVRWLQPEQDLEKSLLSHIHQQLLEDALHGQSTPLTSPHRMDHQNESPLAPRSVRPSTTMQESASTMDSSKYEGLPTASKLRRYGIHFEVGDGGFTGIDFNMATRVLTLPKITVFDTTKAYLLNLLALEAVISNYNHQLCPVSSYILLMDFLIDTEEDVKVLVEKDVIHNQVGSDAKLAEMWNTLATNLPVCFTKQDSKIIDDVKEATRHKFSKCWAGFYDTFCVRKPWLVISIIAAFSIFVLTLLQTIFTIRSAI